MKMNRRKALIGIGSLAVGSGAALGSGAFTSVEATRTVTASVAGDSAALIGLVAQASTDAVQNSGDNGQLEIDLSGGQGADGVNDEAVTTIGEVNEDSSGNVTGVASPAFTIENNSRSAIDVDASVGSGSSLINLQTEDSGGNVNELIADGITGLGASSSVDVAVVVDTTGGSDNTGTGIGDLTFEATRN